MPRGIAGLTTSKYALRSSTQAPANEDEAAFTDTDKMLESVQALYETAAHQFLRDGDCKSELETAKDQLQGILEKARVMEASLQEKATKAQGTKTEEELLSKDSDSEVTLYSKPSNEQIGTMTAKLEVPSILTTLDEMKGRAILSADAVPVTSEFLPTTGMTIEVDDNVSSDSSLAEVDISQFRLGNARRLRA
jgi:hypothetical protein